MIGTESLRHLGLFDARAPRYTSYPPANHFTRGIGADQVAGWIRAVPKGARISLYLHVPYCRRLCWFCACRTQGTTTDRPLVPYLAQLKAELDLVSRLLPQDVSVVQIHLGGGTPTILPPAMLQELGAALTAFRPKAPDLQFSVEIDPTEVDAARIAALRAIGMTRASIGVQDFDPVVQQSIGREQSYARTREVVDMLRAVGVGSLNMDILFGLPHQTVARMSNSVQMLLALNPDRVALYGYAHVPWMARRQVLIPADALPDAETRLALFETARELFLQDGYQEIGIDHFARPADSLAGAARTGRMRRNFQGYTDDASDVLIGLGASAISRFPQGYAQNVSASSHYAAAIRNGQLAADRGHAFSDQDRLRAAMIEQVMCDFALDLPALAARFSQPLSDLVAMTESLRHRFRDQISVSGNRIRLTEHARLIARLAARELDAYDQPEGRHSRAM